VKFGGELAVTRHAGRSAPDRAHHDAEGPTRPPTEAAWRRSLVFRWPWPYRVAWVALVGFVAVCAAAAPKTLGTLSLADVSALAGVLLLGAMGQDLVIMIGGIDLSVPAVMSLAGAILVKSTNGANGQLAKALVEVAIVAIVIGAVNGVLVTVAHLNSLIVTLGINGVVAGAALWWAGTSFSVTGRVPPALANLSSARAGWLSAIAIIGVCAAASAAFVLKHTRVGRNYVAAGANARAAEIIGIRVGAYRIGGFVVAALLFAASGVLLAGYVKTPNLTLGGPYQLLTVVVVALSGAALSGGPTSVLGLVAGSAFLPLLDQFLMVKSLSGGVQAVLQGVVLVVAVAMLQVGSIGQRLHRLLPGRSLSSNPDTVPSASAQSLPTGGGPGVVL
jgi:ribose transport system permease protein